MVVFARVCSLLIVYDEVRNQNMFLARQRLTINVNVTQFVVQVGLVRRLVELIMWLDLKHIQSIEWNYSSFFHYRGFNFIIFYPFSMYPSQKV